MRRSERLQKLIDELRELEQSPRNARLRELWCSDRTDVMPRRRVIPRQAPFLGQIPYTVELSPELWRALFDVNLKDFFTDARCYLETTLEYVIYRFRRLPECTPIDNRVLMWYGVVLESSLFGAEPVFKEDQSPWIAREAVIREPHDLNRLKMPDFRHSGLMPLVHQMYDQLQELAGDDLVITFPVWFRGPFGLATHLRGFTPLLMDLYERPRFVHDLMRFLTDATMQWEQDRARFLGLQLQPGLIANDEVGCPTLSPELYREFVLPYEQELAKFYGGIRYWHSCADTAKLLPEIARIPDLQMLHLGPWTDIEAARKVFGERVAFEKCLAPSRDVYQAGVSQMREELRRIRRALDGAAYVIRADGFQLVKGLEADLEKIQTWRKIAAQECAKEPSAQADDAWPAESDKIGR